MRTHNRIQIIKNMTDQIVRAYEPQRIILFGSYAWGNPGPDSDVDFFIVTSTENTRQTARQINRLLFPRDFPIDVLVFTPQDLEERKDSFFIDEILKRGKTLYART